MGGGGLRRAHVVAIARGGVADELSVDLSAARLGVLERLEHDDAAARAEDKAVAVLIERARGDGRLVVVLARECLTWARGREHGPRA